MADGSPSSYAPRHILIIGATGTIGRHITDSVISARPAFERVTILTSAATAAPGSAKAAQLEQWTKKTAAGGPDVSVLVGDLTSAPDVAAAYRSHGGVDTVISCVGRGALGLQTELIRLAEEDGSPVRWVFPSEYGTDIEHGPQSAGEKPHQLKLAVRRYIRDNVRRLKVTYLVVGPFPEMWVHRSVPGLGGFDVAGRVAEIVGDGDGRIAFTTMPDVGKCLVAALRHPEASLNKALRVASFVTTPNQVLAEYERQTGGGPSSPSFTVTRVSLAELKAKEKQMWEEGQLFAVGATLRRIWAEGGTLYDRWDDESIGLHMDTDMDTLEGVVRGDVQVAANQKL